MVHAKRYRRAYRLGQMQRQVGVRLQITLRDTRFAAAGNRVEAPLAGCEHGWICSDLDQSVLQRLLPRIREA